MVSASGFGVGCCMLLCLLCPHCFGLMALGAISSSAYSHARSYRGFCSSAFLAAQPPAFISWLQHTSREFRDAMLYLTVAEPNSLLASIRMVDGWLRGSHLVFGIATGP